MFQSQAACPTQNFPTSRRTVCSVEPGLIGRRLLPVLAMGALLAAAASVQNGANSASAFAGPVTVQDSSVTALRDKAEAMRAKLSVLPKVAGVSIAGLVQQGLSVEYTQRRLAGFGLTSASLAAAVPVDAAQSRPGHLVLQASAAADLQGVANLPVRAGGRVFRLGDVAMVMRSPLAAPVSTMDIEGRPAAQLSVVPVR